MTTKLNILGTGVRLLLLCVILTFMRHYRMWFLLIHVGSPSRMLGTWAYTLIFPIAMVASPNLSKLRFKVSTRLLQNLDHFWLGSEGCGACKQGRLIPLFEQPVKRARNPGTPRISRMAASKPRGRDLRVLRILCTFWCDEYRLSICPCSQCIPNEAFHYRVFGWWTRGRLCPWFRVRVRAGRRTSWIWPSR